MTSSRMLLARSSMIISIFPLFLVAFFGLAAVHDCQGVWQNCHFMNYNFCYSEQTILNTGAIVMWTGAALTQHLCTNSSELANKHAKSQWNPDRRGQMKSFVLFVPHLKRPWLHLRNPRPSSIAHLCPNEANLSTVLRNEVESQEQERVWSGGQWKWLAMTFEAPSKSPAKTALDEVELGRKLAGPPRTLWEISMLLGRSLVKHSSSGVCAIPTAGRTDCQSASVVETLLAWGWKPRVIVCPSQPLGVIALLNFSRLVWAHQVENVPAKLIS